MPVLRRLVEHLRYRVRAFRRALESCRGATPNADPIATADEFSRMRGIRHPG